jgi:hypothetical protein
MYWERRKIRGRSAREIGEPAIALNELSIVEVQYCCISQLMLKRQDRVTSAFRRGQLFLQFRYCRNDPASWALCRQ